jgi:hypothetical protein
MRDGGKGSRPRPYSVPLDTYGKNFDAIFRKPDPRDLDDARAEDEEFERIDNKQKMQYNHNK